MVPPPARILGTLTTIFTVAMSQGMGEQGELAGILLHGIGTPVLKYG